MGTKAPEEDIFEVGSGEQTKPAYGQGFKNVTGAISDIAGVIATPFNLYEQYKSRKLSEDKWGSEKKLMNQQFIKQQRDLDWQLKFQDRMLGIR